VRRRVIKAIFEEVILGASARLQQLITGFVIKPIKTTLKLMTLLGGYIVTYFLRFVNNI